MKVCKAYTEARIAWEKHYAELERRYEEAERAENWKRAERIGDALAEMEQNSGFKKCFAWVEKAVRPMPTVSLEHTRTYNELENHETKKQSVESDS